MAKLFVKQKRGWGQKLEQPCQRLSVTFIYECQGHSFVCQCKALALSAAVYKYESNMSSKNKMSSIEVFAGKLRNQL